MRECLLKRFAVLFCTLVLLQETHAIIEREDVILQSHSTDENESFINPLLDREDGFSHLRLRRKALWKQYDEAESPDDQQRIKRSIQDTTTQLVQQHSDKVVHTRKKRWVHVIVIGTLFAGVGLRKLVEALGCCKIAGYEDLCKYSDQYEKHRTDLTQLGDEIDSLWLDIQATGAYMENLNDMVGEIWDKMNQFDDNQIRIIAALYTNYTNEVDAAILYLQNEITDLNQTRLEMSYVQETFAPLFDTVEGRVVQFSSLIGYVGSLVFMGIINQLRQGYRLVKELIKPQVKLSPAVKTVVAIRNPNYPALNVKVSGWVKAGSFIKKVASTLLKNINFVIGLATVVYEAVQIYELIDQCSGLIDKAKKDAKDLGEAVEEAKVIKVNATDTLALVETDYALVKEQLTSSDFLEYVKLVLQMIKASAEKSDVLTEAITEIQAFLNDYNTNDKQLMEVRTRGLIDGFQKINYQLECLYKYIGLEDKLAETCSDGLKDGGVIYDDYIASDLTCANFTDDYFSKEESLKALEIKMTELKLQTDCIRNNGPKKDLACYIWLDDKTNEEIRDELNEGSEPIVNLEQAEYYVSDCPTADVSPNLVTLICNKRVYEGANLTSIQALYHKYDAAQIESTYNSCELATLTDTEIMLICILKTNENFKYPPDHVDFDAYKAKAGEEAFMKVYNECA